jgi:biotin transport system substrate-specific component
VVGAYIVGRLTALRRDPGLLWLMGTMTAGIGVLYTLGIMQLMVVAKLDFVRAVWVGLLPFLPGDIIKIVVAALVCRKIRARIYNKI